MAKKSSKVEQKAVSPDLVANALAKSVCDGDIVNFRLLFLAFSPARSSSAEDFETEKYSYLLSGADETDTSSFREALATVQEADTWSHIVGELDAKRPAQLPSNLLLLLADNAVRRGKYSAAAQAYELLRIRRKMQEEFLDQADAALDNGDIAVGVRGYLIGVGLSYDYAAFPEPLPFVPDYQTKALMLHGTYPTRPEECVSLQAPDAHANTALQFLLQDEEVSNRLYERSLEVRLQFLKLLVEITDPQWPEFVERFEDACKHTQSFSEQLKRLAEPHAETLEEEIEEQQAADPSTIMSALLGREIEDGAWWQYIKEIGYEHPAGVLFIARQVIGDQEILMPRLLADSSVPAALGLTISQAGRAE